MELISSPEAEVELLGVEGVTEELVVDTVKASAVATVEVAKLLEMEIDIEELSADIDVLGTAP